MRCVKVKFQKWEVLLEDTIVTDTVTVLGVKTSTEPKKVHPQFELCLVHVLLLHPTLLSAQSLLGCCFWSFQGQLRSVARMTQSQSCWRENVWWCATPPLPLSHREMLWACRWGLEQVGWRFRPSAVPTTNPLRWATAPWPSTLTRWVSACVQEWKENCLHYHWRIKK